MSPPSFPQAFPRSGAPFPPRGPSGRFPRFSGNMEHSDFLPPFARRFVSFASHYPARLGLRSRRRKAPRRGPGNCFPDSQHRFFDGGDRTSQVPGEPYGRAMLYDSGETSALDHHRALVLSSANWKASTPTTNTNFGAQSHGPHIRCLRFAGWIAPSPRKTRFRMAGPPFRTGLVPAGPYERFQLISSSFPKLPWRTQSTASKWAVSQYRNHTSLRTGPENRWIADSMAEREGFEPSVPVTQYARLAIWCLRPLGHLSALGR